jgi:peptidoglycan/xylan/chitin deacetylase (PgdA/CDA1 family)
MKRAGILSIIMIAAVSIALCGCAPNKITASDQQEQGDTGSNTAPKSITAMEILGKSKNLTAKQQDSMDKWRTDIVDLAGKNEGKIFINGASDSKQVALTFDDGPDGSVTPEILDILKSRNVNASFFFIGNNVNQYPEVVRRAYSEGNLVLNHSMGHHEFTRLTHEQMMKEVTDNEDTIYSIIGKRPAIIRPPYGSVSQEELDLLNSSGCKVVIWSIDTLDWSQMESSNIERNVLDNVRNGDIILMHSNSDKQATAEALPDIIDGLQAKGYTIVTLDKLLGVEAYR